jgi:protoheme IX farnesyltransferase
MSLDLAVTDVPASPIGETAVAPTGQSRVRIPNFQWTSMANVVITEESAPSVVLARRMVTDLIQLTKPRIVVMVLVTTLAAGIIAGGSWLTGNDTLWLILGTAMVAASAGAANQVWEREVDRLMPRTALRPLADGRMSVLTGSLFTIALLIAGCVVLNQQFGSVPAMVGIVTWFLYVIIYTPLKVRTAWNTTIGAIAGALPVLIGYTAAGGSLWDVRGWLLVGILVAWQYPHFMAIAWMYRRQYAEAGFQMMTTVQPSGQSAGFQSVHGSLATIVCGGLLCWLVPADSSPSPVYGILGTLLVVSVTWPMLKASMRFAKDRNDVHARRLLRSSLLVLPLVLLIVTLRVFC